ncbi:trigger factor [Aestuariispira insulae]|uniref:Trigger factor n=1 Tax=Aestuariispira insulae TaxID=1461337 RepID=A0A3D9HWQ1_9PROT|nr:trigger factor [Aestuariispira insulae]RED53336.1 trigger factor [Aestuariispira insulae]
MQISEIKNEGLSREYSVTISAADIDKRIDGRLQEVGSTIKIPGFRPGKVPMAILRQRFSKSVMGEVLEAAVNESSQEVLRQNELRPAMQPKIEIDSFDEGKDLIYKMGVECMPEIKEMDFGKIELTRLKAKVDDKEIEEAVERIAKDFRKSEPIAKARKMKSGDVAVIDFKGSVDGVEFPGGAGEGHHLELGSNSFIPGFEEQLVGAKAGDDLDVKVTFPAEYHSEDLAGKDAVFAVSVKETREYVDQEINDEFAKSLGLEDLDQLKGQVRERMENDYNQVSRTRLKRELLDALHEGHEFDVPAGMVEQEFEQIWKQFEQARDAGQLDESETSKGEDELKAEYREIAERRVALGLLLSELGTKNNIQVTQDDLNRAMVQEAQKYPGQEAQVFEFYQKNPEALANLQAPIFEEKVVDFLLEMAKISDTEVSVEELMKDPDEEDAPAPKAKKTKAKKAASKKAAAKKTAAKKAD